MQFSNFIVLSTILIVIAFEYTINKFIYLKILISLINSSGYANALVYMVLVVLSLISISIIPILKSRMIMLFMSGMLFLFYAIEISYRNINSTGFRFNELLVAINENAYASAAFNIYSAQIIASLPSMILLVLYIYCIRKTVKNKYFFSSIYTLIPVVTVMGYYGVVGRTAGADSLHMPAPIRIPALIAYSLGNSLFVGKRRPLSVEPISAKKFKNVIWIIDESVSGNSLTINGNEKFNTTPYLNSIDDQYINLGLVNSVSNCSSTSNIILMSGLQALDLPDSNNLSLKEPSVFQYAKKAGYSTAYLSGQLHGMELQNHMTKYDLEAIDYFRQPDLTQDFEKYFNDRVIIGHIKKLLSENESNYIYVVKYGSHFHWEGSYSDSNRSFTPTLAQHDPLIYRNKEKAINSYMNSIKWSVDGFFDELLSSTDLTDTIVFYTSDHGQSILEEGLASSNTHCDAAQPSISQGTVPLLIFGDNIERLFNFNVELSSFSQFQIFPSTLELFGYQVRQGKSIFSGGDDESRFFWSGDIFGRIEGSRNYIE